MLPTQLSSESTYVRAVVFLPYRHDLHHQYIPLIVDLRDRFGGITHSSIPMTLDSDRPTEFEGWWVPERSADAPTPEPVHDLILWLVIDIERAKFPQWESQLRDIDGRIKREFGQDAGWVITLGAERLAES